MRTSTGFNLTILDGKTISWIDGDEGTGKRVHSIIDPDSDAPPVRILSNRQTVQLDGESTRGLIVFGTHKWDRPTFEDFSSDEKYGYLIDGILAGRGITT